MTTFKLNLTEEQIGRLCKADDDIAMEVVKQQPEIAAKYGLKIVESLERPKPDKSGKSDGK